MSTVRMLFISALLMAPTAIAAAQQPTQQDEFVPISELPPTEQLPAAPLLVGAYVFVLAALFVYVASVAKRVGAVRQEVERLEAELKTRSRS